MAKPESVQEIATIIERMEQLNDEIGVMRLNIRSCVAALKEEICDIDELVEAVNYLYWTYEDVPTTALAELLTGNAHPSKLGRFISPLESELLCRCCGKPMVYGTRNEYQQALRNKRKAERTNTEWLLPTCHECIGRDMLLRDQANQAYRSKIDGRIAQLRAMPYREYLQTPEWQDTRIRRLKSAQFRCQVCNASNVQLDVHHRTYANRGNEPYSDLIVLCHTCHETFHRQGKLSKESS